MPCSYHFAGNQVLVCVMQGVYTLEETFAVFRAGLDDPLAATGVDVVIDITRSQSVKQPQEFRLLVQDLRRHPNFRGRIVAVPSADDPLRFGIARQLAALTTIEGVPMTVQPSVSDAVAWLARRDAAQE